MSKAIITEQHLHDIADVIIAKGGADAPLKPSEMAAAIRAIPSGKSDIYEFLPFDFPDFKKILDEDNEPYLFKRITILSAYSDIDSIELYGGSVYRCSDDNLISESTSHAWDRSKAVNGYLWYVAYSNSEILVKTNPQTGTLFDASNSNVKLTGLASYTTSNGRGWLGLYCDGVLSCKTQTNFSFQHSAKIIRARRFETNRGYQIFNSCESLCVIPDEISVVGGTLELNYCFAQCYSLTRIQSIDISNITGSCIEMFKGCVSLKEIGGMLDYRNSSNVSNVFQDCYCMERLPKLKSNKSISFSHCANVCDRNSVLQFVENINTCSNAGQTITLNGTIMSLFNSEELSSIEMAMTAKNWTLAWA